MTHIEHPASFPPNLSGLSAEAALKTRLTLWQRASTDAAFCARVLAQCERSIEFWIDYFCWTFDPRSERPIQPFVLHPFQRDTVAQLQYHIEHGHDLLIEKSRDMGISWLMLLTFQYYWLFKAGSQFLLGSRKQDYVDQKGDLSTLFEKLRFNLSRLPQWMLPIGFDPKKHDTLMRLQNPSLNNVIVGESSNAQFGRGGRYKAILFDEFPFWPLADAAFAASGQSSPCRMVVGTPYGKQNSFAQLRFSGEIDVLTLHWSLHPHKDNTWYQHQCARMTPNEIARELDINYNLSVENRVFPQFGSEHIVKGLKPLPNRRIIRTWDFGYHCPACVFVQIDDDERVLVLKEVIGEQMVLKTFAEGVLDITEQCFPHLEIEDLCDPAGSQRSDKGDQTSVDILNSLGIFPFYQRSRILRGLEMIRLKLMPLPTRDEHPSKGPALLVDADCEHLIDAFQGGYRYTSDRHELPHEEHPYEDVMDCLRYAIVFKCHIHSEQPLRRATLNRRRPKNKYTGY